MKKRGTGYHLFFRLLLSIRGIIRIVCSLLQILFALGVILGSVYHMKPTDNTLYIVLSIIGFIVMTLGKWLYDELLHKLCPDDMTIIL